MARMGRPTKLTDELVEQAWKYLDSCSDTGVHTLLPTVERLALTLHIHKDTVYDWATIPDDVDADDYVLRSDFSDVLRELQHAQADKLMQNSLLNRYNPTISKLMLSKHGYIEKREEDITSGGDKIGVQLSADQAEQLIKARAERSPTV